MQLITVFSYVCDCCIETVTNLLSCFLYTSHPCNPDFGVHMRFDLMSSVRRKQGDNFGFIDYVTIPYSSTSTCLRWWWQLISVNIWKFYLLLSISDMVSYRKASLPYKNHLDWLLGWMAVFYFWAARQRTRKSTAKEGYRRNVENQIAFMIKLITF